MADQILVASVIVGMLLWLFTVMIVTSPQGDSIPRNLRLYVIPAVLLVIYVVAAPLAIYWVAL